MSYFSIICKLDIGQLQTTVCSTVELSAYCVSLTKNQQPEQYPLRSVPLRHVLMHARTANKWSLASNDCSHYNQV